MKPLRRWLAVLAVGALMCGLTACVGTMGGSQSGEPTHVLIVGDQEGAAGGPQWTDFLGENTDLNLEVDVIDGTGWLTASPESVRDRVAGSNAEVIVLALGAADVAASVPDELRDVVLHDGLAAATATGARVLVLPPLVPTSGGSPSSRWSTAMADAARAAGAAFVEVPLPADAGSFDVDAHRALADRLSELLLPN